MSEMKRYALKVEDGMSFMIEHPLGAYVKYEDVEGKPRQPSLEIEEIPLDEKYACVHDRDGRTCPICNNDKEYEPDEPRQPEPQEAEGIIHEMAKRWGAPPPAASQPDALREREQWTNYLRTRVEIAEEVGSDCIMMALENAREFLAALTTPPEEPRNLNIGTYIDQDT